MADCVIPFLQALGLERDADERAVRRAYAQRLKRIDPATDPQGFQALRSDYENALRWAADQAQRRAAAATPDPGEGATTPVPDEPLAEPRAAVDAAEPVAREGVVDAQSTGEQVFAAFAALASAGFDGEAAARHALDQALGDDRLVNLEALAFFEWRVGCLLMDGWRPGHQFLLGPACDVFHWAHDRRRLTQFGPLGAALDAAIEEKLIFYRQPPHQFEVQRKLVQRLRDDRPPSARTLVDEMPLLQMLVQRYPHWLQVVTSRGNIARWHEWLQALPPDQRVARSEPPAPPPGPRPNVWQPGGSRFGWGLGAGIFFLLLSFFNMRFGGQHSSPPPAWRTPTSAARLPSAWQGSPVSPPGPGPTFLAEPADLIRAERSPGSATVPPPIAQPPATLARDARLKQIKQRQSEVEREMKLAIEEARRAQRPELPPRPLWPTAPVPGAVDGSAPPLQWDGRSKYELLPRNPDGSASAPRLGP